MSNKIKTLTSKNFSMIFPDLLEKYFAGPSTGMQTLRNKGSATVTIFRIDEAQ